jgi:di/tricarboxylate transporter
MTAVWNLFLTLAGVSLLFGCAQANGAMEAVARRALRVCGGRAPLLPPLFFLLAALLAMIGPGAILSSALVAPFAMTAGSRAGVPAFLIALMVGNGANAGNLSPFSTIGAIVSGLMTAAGLGGNEFRVWFWNAAAHAVAGVAAYILFGGLGLIRSNAQVDATVEVSPLNRRQQLTLAVTAAWILGVILWRWPLGLSALAGGAILLAAQAASWRQAIGYMPWKVIALVVGISTAVGVIERAGGLAWFQDAIARFSTPASVHGVVALLTGAISAYSSTSGVVLPMFLPMTQGLAARTGADPLSLAITINIGSALVDVSPMSTIGALCVAAAPEGVNRTALFRHLTFWGLSMALAGAAFCYFAAPFYLTRLR